MVFVAGIALLGARVRCRWGVLRAGAVDHEVCDRGTGLTDPPVASHIRGTVPHLCHTVCMDLPDGLSKDDVVIYGRVVRFPRSLRDSAYPEVWEQALQGVHDSLAHAVEEAGKTPVGDLTVHTYYEKPQQLSERPEWADPGDDGPWFTTVECSTDDPDMDTVSVMLEVPCA